MLSKGIKLGIIGTASVAVVAVGAFAFFATDNNTFSSLKGADERVVGQTISFSSSDTTTDGTTYETIGTTSTGGIVICRSINNDSSNVKNAVAAAKFGTVISFYESDGTPYLFDDIDILSITTEHASALSFTLQAVYNNGSTFSSNYNTSSSNPRNLSFKTLSDVSNICMTCSNKETEVITSIVLTYNCSSKNSTGIRIASEPTRKNYHAGQTFDPSGMVVMVDYDNGDSKATSSYTFSPSGILSPGTTEITVSYKGYSAVVQGITVDAEEVDYSLLGTYEYRISDNHYYRFMFNGSSGTYSRHGSSSASLDFTYSYNQVTKAVSITCSSSFSASGFASGYRLFPGSDVGLKNDNGFVNQYSNFEINLYNFSSPNYILNAVPVLFTKVS